jgi:hypothetical protein
MAIFFTSDIRVATYPNCGFDGNWNSKEGTLYNSSVVDDDSSPDGAPFLRTAYIAGAAVDGGNVQHDIGVGNNGIDTTPVQGMELFMRWMWRARNHYPGGGEQGLFASSSKIIMLGNAAGHEGISRVIVQFRDNGFVAESSAIDITRNIEGGAKVEVTDQVWHKYQAAILSSTSIKETTTPITRSGSTATVNCTAHGFTNGQRVDIKWKSGTEATDEWLHDGPHTITVVNANTFTFPTDPTAPAVGTSVRWLMSADARLRLWVDDFTVGSPEIDIGDLGISVIDWSGGGLRYGGFLGLEPDTLPSTMWTPAPIIDMGTFQTGDTFDSTWGAGGAPDTTLAGVAAGVGLATGDLALDITLAGTAAGVGTIVGDLALDITLAGQADGVGSMTGELDPNVQLAGIASGVGTASGNLVALTLPPPIMGGGLAVSFPGCRVW